MLKSAVAAVALCASFALSGHTWAAPSARTSGFSAVHQLLAIINRDREAAGVGPLRAGHKLDHVALQHSYFMAQVRRLSHDGPGAATPYTRIAGDGIRYRIAGENVGLDSGAGEGAMLQAIETAMLNSPEHRANLLRTSFTRVGLGVVVVGDRLYVTEDFTG